MSSIRLEKDGAVAVMRIDKGKGNAIDEALVEDLAAAASQVAADDAVKGVLFASAHPKLFCPGLDLPALLEFDRARLERFMRRFSEVLWALYGLSKPMVAAVNGHAVAGGCIFALTADWRVLKRGGAQIGLAEVKVGLPLPWSVTVLLRYSVAPWALSRIGLLGRNFSDEEAVAVGLADELADGEGFEQACLARLGEFVDKDARAVALTKGYLRAGALREMKAADDRHVLEFLDSWFSEAGQARIRGIVASLKK